MRKIKTTRRKVRGKNMKKLFACLLSISMIPVNGVAVFANENQTVQTEAEQEVKQQDTSKSNVATYAETDNENVTFSRDSRTIQVGEFKGIQFDNIDEDDIRRVEFEYNDDIVEINDIKDEYGHEYIPQIKDDTKKQTTIGATIYKKNGDEIEVPRTIFEIKKQTDSNIVPIKSYGIYKALYTKSHKSVDQNQNGKIEQNELKKVRDIDFEELFNLDTDVQGDELDVLKDATECQEINLCWINNLTNIDFVKSMTKLVGLKISDRQLTTLGNSLDHVKNQLKYLNLDETEIPFNERVKYLKDEVTIQEGTACDNLILQGLLDYCDTKFEILDDKDSVLSAQEDYGDYGRTIKISAKEGSAGKSGILKIQNGENSKTIKINIVSKNQDRPGFAQKSIKDTVGHFSVIQTEDGANLKSVSVENEKVAKAESYGEREEYYLEPQNEGTTQIIGYFYKDGVEYTDTIDVTISKAPDNIVPLKSFSSYKGMKNKDGKSVDTNKDKQIDKTEILNVDKIWPSDNKITENDVDGWEQAINCTEIHLGSCYDLRGIKWIAKFSNLKYLDISYTSVKDISVLDTMKDHLTELDAQGSDVPALQRYAWMPDKEIELEVGSEVEIPLSICHLLTEDDEISVSDPLLASYKEGAVPSIDEGTVKLLEATGSKGTTTLTIRNGNAVKEIPIKVVDKKEDAIGFSQKNITIKQHSFIQAPIKNFNKEDAYYVTVKSSDDYTGDEDPDDILDTAWGYDSNGVRVEYLVPKKAGTVTIVGRFEKADGRVYGDTMTVTVVPNDNEKILPLTDYRVYFALQDDQGKSVDTNNDGQIDQTEIKNVKQMLFDSGILTTKKFAILEAAENCVSLDISYNEGIKNLDFLDKMKKLQKLNLEGDRGIKDFSKLKSFKDQLTYLNLTESNISDEERFSFIRNNEISVGAGNEITNPILPSGIVNDTDTYAIEDTNIAEVVDTRTLDDDGDEDQRIVTIKGKKGQEGKETNLIITSEDGEVKKIPVKIVQGSIVNPPIIDPSKPGGGEQKPSSGEQKPSSGEQKPSSGEQKPANEQHNSILAIPQKVETITITGISKNIASGKKIKLTVSAKPDSAANKSVTWTTSNKKVATVNASGVVSINKKAAGKSVTITATAKDGSGKKVSYKIKVMKGAVKKVKISGKKSVKAGKTLKLKAKVTASKGANKKLIWTSSNPNYATVSSSGKVKALKAGKKKSVKITVMATDGSGKKATVTIKIK